VEKRSLWRGSPARELEPTAAYRLGVDTGGAGGKIPGRLLDGKIFLWAAKVRCCWAAKADNLWLGHSSAQLSLVPTQR
jgi:hypothetical protein